MLLVLRVFRIYLIKTLTLTCQDNNKTIKHPPNLQLQRLLPAIHRVNVLIHYSPKDSPKVPWTPLETPLDLRTIFITRVFCQALVRHSQPFERRCIVWSNEQCFVK